MRQIDRLRRRLRHMMQDLGDKIMRRPPRERVKLQVIGLISSNQIQTFPQKWKSQKEVIENDE